MATSATLKKLKGSFEVCSKSLRIYKDSQMRQALVKIFEVFGAKFENLKQVASLISDLNSYSTKRIREPDFPRRLDSFRLLNEVLYMEITSVQWVPLLYALLFFINDPDEIAIRSNAAHTLTRFIDCLCSKNETDIVPFLNLVRTVVVPNLRGGLKKDQEDIRYGYIGVLSHIVRRSDCIPEFSSMKILLSEDPEEDFFNNFGHIQITAKQKAIRSLPQFCNDLSPEVIYQYIIPMTEMYTVCKDEKLRNLLDDTQETWAQIACCLNWENFRQLFKKHISAVLKSSPEELRDRANLVVRLSQALLKGFKLLKEGSTCNTFRNLPDDRERLDKVIMEEFYKPVMNVVKIRDDETVTKRTPMVEALVNCLLCVSPEIAEASLSGTLTSTCQVLRSRTQDLRDSVRKTLGKVARILGAHYFRFIIKELQTALSRGAQIHVLSYTVHSLLNATKDIFEVGDLDDSASQIVEVIMEDTFGAAGQEKDAEGYVSKMREVKSKKSYDSAEHLAGNITLPQFGKLVEPIKKLLLVNIPLRTKRKLDELLRKYALGLHANPLSGKREILVLCYELHKQSTTVEDFKPRKKQLTDSEDHFLVQAERPQQLFNDKSQVLFTLQTMCYEMLRTALGKHKHLLTVENVDGFIPLFESSIEGDDESMLIALFKVLNLVVKLPFSENRDEFFLKTASKAFTIIQNLPTTTSEISQITLRYLATVLRHKPDLELNELALTYILVRLLPDLEEPDKQGLAFNFLKAVVAKHIVLPEVYDVMDKVCKIMVVNHTKEIRDIARSVFFKFTMEYEHGSSKLTKTFKFLVNNLSYPTESGRLSVMEFMYSLILKSSPELLDKLAPSFFVGISQVLVSDSVPKCREMASELIKHIFEKCASSSKLATMEEFCSKWLSNDQNKLLQRCGLSVYKVYVSTFGFGKNKKLDALALKIVESTIVGSNLTEMSSEWEEVYTAMNVFSGICTSLEKEVFAQRFEKIWRSILDTLLYPHSWVRLLSSRLVGLLLSNIETAEFELTPQDIQTVTYRLIRQLSAPGVTSTLGGQAVKNMIPIIKKWQAENTPYYSIGDEKENDEKEEEKGEEEKGKEEKKESKYSSATIFVIDRITAIIRNQKAAHASRVACIQLGAMVSQMTEERDQKAICKKIIHGLYTITEEAPFTPEEIEVFNLATECLKIVEDKLGTTEYASLYTEVKMEITNVRSERKTTRAQLAISAPDLAARRKIRKHERFREKRKNLKDENGYYKAKKRRHI